MDIDELQKAVAAFRDERDWAQFHTPKDLASAISIEASELLELFLWKDEEAVSALLRDDSGRDHVADEMADIFAFLLSLADITDLDLSDALMTKLAKNDKKYPREQAKGRSDKYHVYKK